MRPFSVCLSLMVLSACLSSMAKPTLPDREDATAVLSSFQGLDFKNRLIQREYLYQKHGVSSLSSLFEQQNPLYNIENLIQCEEMVVLGKSARQLDSTQLSHVIHTAGLTHLESFLTYPQNKPFLSTQTKADQDAFKFEYTALCDISRIFNSDEWVPFRLRVDTELSKYPSRYSHQNTFYADIQRQARERLMAQHLRAVQVSQR